MPVLVEICVEGIDGLIAAQQAGADRAELCASLLEGGITPSIGTIRHALAVATIPFHPIIRPRGGDFLYSTEEFESMRDDVIACRDLGVKGVVFGCLTADGRIDRDRMTRLVAAAGPMSTTCHRAFDMTRDFRMAVETLIDCGVDRVLTSGQKDDAVSGIDTLRETVGVADGRLKVMACGDLNPDIVARVVAETGVPEIHFAAPRTIPSAMTFRNAGVGMGGTENDREYQLTLTDPDLVRATIAAARPH